MLKKPTVKHGMNGIIPAAINKDDGIRKRFNIPEHHEAMISIIFGYPKYRYQKIVKRRGKKINWVE